MNSTIALMGKNTVKAVKMTKAAKMVKTTMAAVATVAAMNRKKKKKSQRKKKNNQIHNRKTSRSRIKRAARRPKN